MHIPNSDFSDVLMEKQIRLNDFRWEDLRMRTIYTDNLVFHVQENFTGEVVITVPDNLVEDGLSGKKLVTVPFSEIKSLVMEYIRWRAIQNFKTMSHEDLESWATPGFNDGDGHCETFYDSPMTTVIH